MVLASAWAMVAVAVAVAVGVAICVTVVVGVAVGVSVGVGMDAVTKRALARVELPRGPHYSKKVHTRLYISGFRIKIIEWHSIIRVIPNVARFGDLIKSLRRRWIIPAN